MTQASGHNRDPVLRGERVVLRRTREADLGRLAAIIGEPEVQPWWGEHDVDRLRKETLEEGTNFTIEVDGEVAGLLLVWEEDDPDYRHAALDISLGTAWHDRGLGREALRLAIDHLAARGHHRFTIDPSAENERAIRCYAAVGFRPVGKLRRYWHAPDGSWRDGLLMDLLVEELP